MAQKIDDLGQKDRIVNIKSNNLKENFKFYYSINVFTNTKKFWRLRIFYIALYSQSRWHLNRVNLQSFNSYKPASDAKTYSIRNLRLFITFFKNQHTKNNFSQIPHQLSWHIYSVQINCISLWLLSKHITKRKNKVQWVFIRRYNKKVLKTHPKSFGPPSFSRSFAWKFDIF